MLLVVVVVGWDLLQKRQWQWWWLVDRWFASDGRRSLPMEFRIWSVGIPNPEYPTAFGECASSCRLIHTKPPIHLIIMTTAITTETTDDTPSSSLPWLRNALERLDPKVCVCVCACLFWWWDMSCNRLSIPSVPLLFFFIFFLYYFGFMWCMYVWYDSSSFHYYD
jgi:hypothetical protein